MQSLTPMPKPRSSSQQIHRINHFASPDLRDADLCLFDPDALRSHMWVLGAPGTGKSAGIANALLWPLFYRGFPCLILDPVGALSRWLLWHICHYPPYLQPYLFDRLVYIARGARDYVVPTPLYTAQDEHESFYTTASRFINVAARVDPFLATASVEGKNALTEAGLYAGQLAAAMGLQITEVAAMLRHPERWLERVRPVVAANADLKPAFDYLVQLKDASATIQARKTGSFMNKLIPFLADPVMQAQYAASGPGLQLSRHVQAGDTVLFDYALITDRDHKQFAMLWDFLNIFEWVKGRGMAGREMPCLLCIDEVSAMTNLHMMEHSILSDDIAELATQWARNLGVQLCFMNQTPSQLPPTIVTALSQFGTKLIGNIPHIDDALYLARLIYDYDPHRVRKTDKVWVNDPIPEYHATGPHATAIFARANFRVIDTRTTEYSIDEQYLLAAQALQHQPPHQFIAKAAQGEGNLTGSASKVSFAHLINGHYPDQAKVSEAQAQARKKWGIPLEQVRKEIRQRTHQPVSVRKRQQNRRKKQRAILDTPQQQEAKGPAVATRQHHEKHRDLPVEPQADAPAKPGWKQALWASNEGDDHVHQT